MSQEIKFHYFPAFLCSIEPPVPRKDPSGKPDPKSLLPRVRLWLQHPANPGIKYDHNKTILVDLDSSPSRPKNGNLPEVDDHANSPHFGFTTIGPMFPHAYSAGAVYLSDHYLTAHAKDVLAALGLELDSSTAIDGSVDVTSALGQRTESWPGWKHDLRALVRLGDDGKVERRFHGFVGLKLDASSPLWVVYHPDTASPATSRAPRKVLLRDGSVSRIESSSAVGPAKLFLEQDFARYVAVLDVPKRPSGSGERLVTAAAPGPGRTDTLSVFGHELTGEVAAISMRVKHDRVDLSDRDTLASGVAEWATKHPETRYENLDLIGHSRSIDQLLKLGELILTPRRAKTELEALAEQGVLQLLGIKRIRFLGCQTAGHPKARRAVEAVRDALVDYIPDVQVHASRADLFAAHFGATGLLQEAARALLADQDVVTWNGPGDLPPHDDYPVAPSDEGDTADPPPPSAFRWSTLSGANDAKVSACRYALWKDAAARFEELRALVNVDTPVRDHPLVRPDVEVLLATAGRPESIDDYRSFDVCVDRVRVHAGDACYSFAFKSPPADVAALLALLRKMDITISELPLESASQSEGE